jgi:hypothetical protein
MTDLSNLASRITDYSNAITQAEQGVVSTMRAMYEAGATVVAYNDGTDRPIMLAVYPAGADTDEIDEAIITFELSAGYRGDLDFAVEA